MHSSAFCSILGCWIVSIMLRPRISWNFGQRHNFIFKTKHTVQCVWCKRTQRIGVAPRWYHDIDSLLVLLVLCEGNPSQMTSNAKLFVLFAVGLSKLSKVLEAMTLIWRHCNVNFKLLSHTGRNWRECRRNVNFYDISLDSIRAAIQSQSHCIWSGFEIFWVYQKESYNSKDIHLHIFDFLKFPYQYGSNNEISACWVVLVDSCQFGTSVIGASKLMMHIWKEKMPKTQIIVLAGWYHSNLKRLRTHW